MKNTILKSFWGGVFIALGTLVFLSLYPDPLGALLFSSGLLSIFILELKLFTGAVTFLCKENCSEILTILFFNFIGCLILFFIPKNEIAVSIIQNKISLNSLYLFFNSALCGISISAAFLCHKRQKTWMAIIYVMFFILTNLNHCIANVCLIICSRIFTIQTLRLVVISILGNAIGSIIFYRTGVFKCVTPD